MNDEKAAPNYLEQVMVSLKTAGENPGVWVSTVAHDEWCDHWNGKPCNCDPVVRMTRMEERGE